MTHRVRRVLLAAAARAMQPLGFELVPLWRLPRRPMAEHLRALFRRLKINCVLDVGGNLGQYRDFLRDDVGYQGRIISFEPIAALANALEERAKGDPSWEICRCALGAADEERVLHVMKHPNFSSFLAPTTSAVDQFAEWNSIEHEESVPVRRLDTVLRTLPSLHGLDRPYLKMDTQGFDLEVVRGATAVLPTVRALQTEASILPIYHGMPSWITAVETLQGLGFEISGFFPVSTDPNMRLIEVDCVMINRAPK